jgi:hypothetical protein
MVGSMVEDHLVDYIYPMDIVGNSRQITLRYRPLLIGSLIDRLFYSQSDNSI